MEAVGVVAAVLVVAFGLWVIYRTISARMRAADDANRVTGDRRPPA